MQTADQIDSPLCKENRSPQLARLVVDIDNFRNLQAVQPPDAIDALINILIGRLTGLQGVCDVCRATDASDVVCLSLEGAATARIGSITRQVQNAVRQRFDLGGTHVYVTASIGISRTDGSGTAASDLTRQARIASLSARNAGGNHCANYAPAMDARMTRQTQIAQGLHGALHENQFTLTFQPQFALLPASTNAVRRHTLTGAEALLRWKSPELGQIGPAEFIPIAESTGMVREIDFHVMALFARQVGRWRARGHHLQSSLNLSSCSFEDDTLAPRLLELLAIEGVDPRGVTVEITETALLSMSPPAIANIDCFRRAGISLSVDDFGSGYASLSYLRDMIVSEIKIDKSFIRGLSSSRLKPSDGHDNARVIVGTILDMARSLNIRALAEGVERRDQLTWLHGEGCRTIQGHVLGRAVSPDVFERTHFARHYSV